MYLTPGFTLTMLQHLINQDLGFPSCMSVRLILKAPCFSERL